MDLKEPVTTQEQLDKIVKGRLERERKDLRRSCGDVRQKSFLSQVQISVSPLLNNCRWIVQTALFFVRFLARCAQIVFDMKEKIWELLLVLFDVCLTTAPDIAREGYKKNHEKYLINITVVTVLLQRITRFNV